MFLTKWEEAVIIKDTDRILAARDSVPVHFFYKIAASGVLTENDLFGEQEGFSEDLYHASCFCIYDINKPRRQADGTFQVMEDYDAVFYIKEIPDADLINNESVIMQVGSFQWKPIPLQKIRPTAYNTIFHLRAGQIWTILPAVMHRG